MNDVDELDRYEPTGEELQGLLAVIWQETGYDFRNYCESMIRRRVKRVLKYDGFSDVEQLLSSLSTREETMRRLTSDFLIHVTELFRDPGMYSCIKHRVLPDVGSMPHLRIWVVGCSTGEEAFSVAVLLREAGMLDKSRIYATDLSSSVLKEARLARFHGSKYELYARKYREAGGLYELSDYVERREGYCYFRHEVADAITFSRHDLTRDGCFHEFDIVLCRNVMIYFNQGLKSRVNQLLYQSLKPGGYLVLGDKETIRFTEFESEYRRADASEKVYQKLKGEV